jgi:hypothetical protein
MLCSAVSQWLSQQQQQQQQPPSAAVPLLSFQHYDPDSRTMTWQLLNAAALYSSSSSSSSSGAAAAGDCAGSADVLHPIGAQIAFPAALGTLEMEIHPLLPGIGGLPLLLSSCISCSPGRLLSDVAAAADSAEFWGPGMQGLQQYLAQNFVRAAVQGRLFMQPGISSSSSGGGASSASNSNSSSRPASASGSRMPLFGVAGAILALREQREQEAQREAQRATLLFNTGLVSDAGQQVLLVFKEGSGAAGSR